MELIINDGKPIDKVSADQLREQLPKLDVDEFAVLTRADEQYIQFYRHDDGYQLEYRGGSCEQHFEVDSEELTIDDVVAAFAGYLEDDLDRWQTNHRWSRIEFDEDFAGDDFLTHYELNGKEYARIRVGKENSPVCEPGGDCSECVSEFGDYHEEGCVREECPRCHGTLVECDCE